MVSCVYSFSFVNMMFSDYRTEMKAGRSSYDCGDVSVTTARSARSKNCYKKARKWDRVNLTCTSLIIKLVHVAFSLGKII